ncbi:MAG: S-methyl-5'-thioadenosine phosphorylase [Deltaproteobacteria bacterium]|nr:S-methyl-5'-thioadenosine phosphorylase [Deltaproteobacteria bacterium]
MTEKLIGIIGGSGLYEIEGFRALDEKKVNTPFGEPSDAIIVGELNGRKVAFLPRHGKGHRFSPSTINYRANICALKMLGVEWIISVSAVGSLKEEIAPGDFVVVDQFIDRTKFRAQTFFDDGITAHVSFAHPVCSSLADVLYNSASSLGIKTHKGGTYVCMEGPAFSTRAESFLHRQWGADLIGMTGMPEAKLAREAEICYATIALSTDYDCWKEEEHANVGAIVATIKKNVSNSKSVIRDVVAKIPEKRGCPCANALSGAIMTDLKTVPMNVKKKLEVIAGRYFKA